MFSEGDHLSIKRGGVNIVEEISEGHIRNSVPFWSPQFRKDIDTMERIQYRASGLIPGQERLSYEERLKETGLYTLERRRLRGDMIEMCKIMKGGDKTSEDELFNRVDRDRTSRH